MVAPDYQPWFQPLYEPASGEIESLLFTLQGSLGAAVIFTFSDMRGADSAVMTGFDLLSYQSRWLQVAPERKFLLWLLLMVLAFTLPAWGRALTLALTAALTCWLLRVSFWRWCRWMALPFGFLLVGVLTILFSVSRDPQMLLASFRLGAFSIGISARAGRGRGDLLAQPGGDGGDALAGA